MSNLRVAADINVVIEDRYTLSKLTPEQRIAAGELNVKSEPLPNISRDLAKEVITNVLQDTGRKGPGGYNILPSKNFVIQAIGAVKSVELKKHAKATSLFLNTVHDCFANHYPLGIRPEALMYMVLNEIGVTVKQNVEEYRDLFTDSKDKKLISVRVDTLDISNFNQMSEWMVGIQLLHSGLKNLMPTNLLDQLLPEISTHDLNSQTASMVAVLDAASPYYSYLMRTCCGIPSIRLFGCAQDYDNIVAACEILSEKFKKHLGNYFAHLLPVLKEIADTASGRKAVNNDFWLSIYNHYGGSGTDDMDGWITAFVNYTFSGGSYSPKSDHLYDWKENLKKNRGSWGSGIHVDTIPKHVSCVPFIWDYFGTNYDCRLMGGFLSVENIDGYATPALGWAVVRGEQAPTKVNEDGTVTVTAVGQTPITF